jgi:hypothetical protein
MRLSIQGRVSLQGKTAGAQEIRLPNEVPYRDCVRKPFIESEAHN